MNPTLDCGECDVSDTLARTWGPRGKIERVERLRECKDCGRMCCPHTFDVALRTCVVCKSEEGERR